MTKLNKNAIIKVETSKVTIQQSIKKLRNSYNDTPNLKIIREETDGSLYMHIR